MSDEDLLILPAKDAKDIITGFIKHVIFPDNKDIDIPRHLSSHFKTIDKDLVYEHYFEKRVKTNSDMLAKYKEFVLTRGGSSTIPEKVTIKEVKTLNEITDVVVDDTITVTTNDPYSAAEIEQTIIEEIHHHPEIAMPVKIELDIVDDAVPQMLVSTATIIVQPDAKEQQQLILTPRPSHKKKKKKPIAKVCTTPEVCAPTTPTVSALADMVNAISNKINPMTQIKTTPEQTHTVCGDMKDLVSAIDNKLAEHTPANTPCIVESVYKTETQKAAIVPVETTKASVIPVETVKASVVPVETTKASIISVQPVKSENMHATIIPADRGGNDSVLKVNIIKQVIPLINKNRYKMPLVEDLTPFVIKVKEVDNDLKAKTKQFGTELVVDAPVVTFAGKSKQDEEQKEDETSESESESDSNESESDCSDSESDHSDSESEPEPEYIESDTDDCADVHINTLHGFAQPLSYAQISAAYENEKHENLMKKLHI